MPTSSAVIAMPKPRSPSRQITTNAPSASIIAISARISAPPTTASEGMISKMPERTMTMPSSITATEKPATRRAHIASREVGSACTRRAKIGPPYRPVQIRFSAAHSDGSSNVCGARGAG